ncbi:TIGR04084 family radical SAM/SPASM domain-containing protein [archaeon]|jgi:uncharacterized protein|nr:TIGR04084 family radical SAM/SPASM domain-containing protein [archaeon]MBT4396937.1 TIGR04084 family radical SAM/SPASM domain-containing protein [archaeon]MBT4440928.1 TIGR04084 family radical SAM/SPASM domain-containing protein [archaeon]
MFYHVITSTECNLECKYCVRDEFTEVEEDMDYCLPPRISYDIERLKKFITKEDYVTFYGGEPLLAMEDIKKIMDSVECKGFMTQTNGLFLDQLGDYIERFHTILVSIDGDEEITDKNRGKDVFKKVMNNVNLIKEKFKGELIARMTITRGSNVYKQVLWLSNQFDSIHWQLDAMFFEERTEWLGEYNKQVDKLVDEWVSRMERGKVERWYPFLVIMDSLLKNEKSKLRCGSGYANYTIATNGKIAPCPIMCGFKEFYCGELGCEKLKEVYVKEPCTSCDVLDTCGGRCLYSNITKLWKENDYKELCGTIKFLIKKLESKKSVVEELLNGGIIKEKDFEHLKFNGVEVIP